jgi:hypothetical protein
VDCPGRFRQQRNSESFRPREAVTDLRSYRLIKHLLLAFQLKNVEGYPVLNVKVVFAYVVQQFLKFPVEFFDPFARK